MEPPSTTPRDISTVRDEDILPLQKIVPKNIYIFDNIGSRFVGEIDAEARIPSVSSYHAVKIMEINISGHRITLTQAQCIRPLSNTIASHIHRHKNI